MSDCSFSAPLGSFRTLILGMMGALWYSIFVLTTCAAHEVRPAYLELRELRTGEFEMLFKTPMRGDLRLSLAPAFSGRASL